MKMPKKHPASCSFSYSIRTLPTSPPIIEEALRFTEGVQRFIDSSRGRNVSSNVKSLILCFRSSGSSCRSTSSTRISATEVFATELKKSLRSDGPCWMDLSEEEEQRDSLWKEEAKLISAKQGRTEAVGGGKRRRGKGGGGGVEKILHQTTHLNKPPIKSKIDLTR